MSKDWPCETLGRIRCLKSLWPWMDVTARAAATKGKLETLEIIQTKQLLFFKLNHQKSKARTCRMETIFVNHVPNRVSVSIIYKEHVQNPLRICEAVSLDCVGPGKMPSPAIRQTQPHHSHAGRTSYKGYNFKKEPKCWQKCVAVGTLTHYWAAWCSFCGGSGCSSKDYTLWSYDPVIPFLGIFPREMKTFAHTKTCEHGRSLAVFVITKMGNPLRCLPAGEWITSVASSKY